MVAMTAISFRASVESLILSTNQRPAFDHMVKIWTNERTGFDGKIYPKAPPFGYFCSLISIKIQYTELLKRMD